MKLIKGTHKAVLSSLFYEKTGQNTSNGLPIFQPKQIPFDKLMDASSAAKKINEGSELTGVKITYPDGEIEFTPAEVTVVKELFDANKDKWDVTVADSIKELIELFEGKKDSAPIGQTGPTGATGSIGNVDKKQ